MLEKEIIKQYFGIEDYLEVINNVNMKDLEWQKKFNGYYKLRLSNDLLKEIFDFYECAESNEYAYLINNYNGFCPVVFSKILSIDEPSSPIIDKNVLDFFNVKINTKNQAIEIYNKLKIWYGKYLESAQFSEYEKWFDKFINKNIDKYKKVDYLLWFVGNKNNDLFSIIKKKYLKGFDKL